MVRTTWMLPGGAPGGGAAGACGGAAGGARAGSAHLVHVTGSPAAMAVELAHGAKWRSAISGAAVSGQPTVARKAPLGTRQAAKAASAHTPIKSTSSSPLASGAPASPGDAQPAGHQPIKVVSSAGHVGAVTPQGHSAGLVHGTTLPAGAGGAPGVARAGTSSATKMAQQTLTGARARGH